MKSVSEITKTIRLKTFASVYLLLGKEKFFHDQIIKELSTTLFSDRSSRSLNRILLHGSENSLSEVVSASLSYPMLSDYKFVLVKEFNKIKTTDSDAFLKYLENPQKTSILVLSCEELGKSKMVAKLMKVATTINCMPIPEYKISSWLKERISSRGLKINQIALAMLSEYTGNNLLTIEHELNKITEFKLNDSEINENDILAVTGMSKEYNVFAFQRALSTKNYNSSYIIGKNLIDAGENLNLIVSIIFSFFKKALLLSKNLAKTGSLKISDFQKKEISITLKKFDIKTLENIIQILASVDKSLKSSTASDLAIMQYICYNVCRN